MIATLFQHARDNRPETVECASWEELVRLVGRHRASPSKLETPAISPAEYPPGIPRSKDNVRRVHFAMLDFDGRHKKGLTRAELQRVLEITEGTRAMLYTSWSHAEVAEYGRWKFRLILALSRPVEGDEWSKFWLRLHDRYGNASDSKCKDSSRIYFLPAAPDPSQGIVEVQEGEPIDVDAMLALPDPPPLPIHEDQIVGIPDVAELAARLTRSKSPVAKAAGKAVQDCLGGVPPAVAGDRDNTLFMIAGHLAQEWPYADPEALAATLRSGLSAMQTLDITGDCPGEAEFAEKIGRLQDKVKQELRDADNARREHRAGLILDAFDGDRAEPYTEDELDGFAAEAGVDRGAFARRWVVQAGRSYYLYLGGSYSGPFASEEIVVAADRILAAAHTARVDVWRVSSTGSLAPKTPQQLMLDYGSVASQVVVELGARKSYFDGHTIVEVPCPLTSLHAKYDGRIQDWLMALGGEQAETLLDWLAAAPQLDKPCAALYLDGPAGIGKTLFAVSLAKLWGDTPPTPLKEIVRDFNETIVRNPLIFADEVIPERLKKGEGTGFLRQLIQARTHYINRKFKSAAVVKGAVRLVMAANNKYLLDDSEVLSPDDIAAVIERFVYIHANDRARQVLESYGPDFTYEIAEGGLAQHSLHLRDTRARASGARFLVAGSTSELHRALTTGRGMSSAICHWCIGYLMQPSKLDTQRNLLVRIHEGSLLLNFRALSDHWDTYVTHVAAPSAGQLKKALTSVSEPGYKQLIAGDGKRTNYRKIKTENLVTWNEEIGCVAPEEILRALETDTPVL